MFGRGPQRDTVPLYLLDADSRDGVCSNLLRLDPIRHSSALSLTGCDRRDPCRQPRAPGDAHGPPLSSGRHRRPPSLPSVIGLCNKSVPFYGTT
jgi:hypothetical protein